MLTGTEIRLIAENVAKEVLKLTDEPMTLKTCAEWLGISPTALQRRCETRQIPYHKKHNRLQFFKNEITAYYKAD